MKNSVLVLLIASLVVVGFGGCVWATEYDVKQDGGGDFTTIQAAVDAATSGDTIVVCEGDTPYYEAVDISTGGIILRAAINESPIIDAQNIRSYCITMKEYVCGNNVTVDGFICRNFTCATGQKVGGIWLRSGVNHIVKNCEIYGGPSSGSDKADISSYGGSNATIENNYLHSSGIYANIITYGSNMVIRGNNITGGRNGVVMKVWDSPESGSNHLIEKNYVHDLATSGDTRLGAFYLRDGQYFVIRNNVIYNCPNQKGGFFLYDSMDYGYPEEHHEIFNNIIDNAGYNGAVSMERQQNNTIKNNIIIDSLYAVGFEDWGGPYSTGHLFDYNCHYNNGVVSNDMSKFSDMIQDPNHNILLNPGVQASGSRPSPYYHLQDSSPCKNAGDLSTTEDQAGLVDYDGNARFVGQIDIGAFEYFYTSNTTPPNCFNPAPSGIIPSGTTSTNISLSTNMQAVCRYSNNSGTNYTSMEHNFTSTNSTNHSAQVSGLENGQTYVFYVRCNSSNGFVNDDDFNISFSVGGHKADINDDSVISMRELIAFIARWKANDGVSKAEVLAARDIWFTGGVY